MMTILLYGGLGKQFGRVHKYDVRTVGEAMRAMGVTLKGFRQAIQPQGFYKVLVGGKDALTSKEQMHEPLSHSKTLRIVPVISGSGPVARIIAGIILIVIGVFTMGSTIGLGVSLIIGGVSEILFAPKAPKGPADRPDNLPSFTFNGAVNTAAEGNAVSVLYGRAIVGSQVGSAGLSVAQL